LNVGRLVFVKDEAEVEAEFVGFLGGFDAVQE
jgi:hypothetical protein